MFDGESKKGELAMATVELAAMTEKEGWLVNYLIHSSSRGKKKRLED